MLRYGSTVTLTIVLSASAIRADSHSFNVEFANCTEFIGQGPAPLPLAQRLVPSGYVVAAISPERASIVVRITNCEAVQVDRTRAAPTTISQIGINIVSPDGTGSINNYLLAYVTNNPFLAEALQHIDVPANYDPTITYEYRRDTTGSGGVLYGAVADASVPAWFFYGTETEPPPNTQQPFVANWWHGEFMRVRQQTTFPAISFGTAKITLYTSTLSPLGQLIGGNAYGDFSILALRGVYGSAEMIVSAPGR
jgi:hypothetical protein